MAASVRLRLYEAFDLLWSAHLNGKPSARAYTPARKALVRSFGGKYLDEITPFDFREHRRKRLTGEHPFQQVGLGSVFHDHGLMHLVYSKIEEWKVDGLKPEGLNLSRLVLPNVWPTYKSRKKRSPKRKVFVSPEEFKRLCNAATERLRRTLEALVDLDIREGDLHQLRATAYNPYTDQIEWVQAKTGRENCVPVTERVRRHFTEARAQGREFVYDLTNSRKEFEEARRLAKVRPNITKRDLRKTAYNEALRHTKDYRIAGMLAGHSSTRTGMDHYEIEFREDLKPVVKHLEETYKSN